MTILVVLVGMLAGLVWLLPETEAQEQGRAVITEQEYEQENPRA